MAQRPAKKRTHKRAPAEDVQPDAEVQILGTCEQSPSICTAGPLDNMPDGDEDDEDEGDVLGDGD